MVDQLLEIFFLPPMAIARLGSGSNPSDSFRWVESMLPEESRSTLIRPSISLDVEADGSVTPRLPEEIVFKDAAASIRPVAPFFELWAKLQHGASGAVEVVPLNLSLLNRFNLSPGDVRYEIVIANRKAERRTGDAACSFVARAVVPGSDCRPHELLAFSPHTSGQEPLVYPERPIQLGTFQVIRPVEKTVASMPEVAAPDCSILRVRFTPPKGLVYGPPDAGYGPAPEVAPGLYEDAATQFGRIHEIVRPEHRILNGTTIWSRYIMMNGAFRDPPPQDGYDGAAVGDFRSWGCVDDTSDGIIEARLAIGGRRYRAVARVITGPPDFAPDRRPVYSVADDIADRELPPVEVCEATYQETKVEVLDFFHRAFETASLFNLDACRARALQENRIRLALHVGPSGKDEPKADGKSMTAQDKPYIDKLATLAPQRPSRFTEGTPNDELPYTNVVTSAHAPLKEELILLDFLRLRADHVKRVVRPPFARVCELPMNPAADSNPRFRDPRVFRDQLHDMRMPPYMRDANLQPLSLSWRQHRELVEFTELLGRRTGDSNISRGEGISHRDKIFPRNLTARMAMAARCTVGNPVTTRMESAVGNCFPGLEFDVRELDCRFFPGLVFQFVTKPLYPAKDARPDQQGVFLYYTDWLLDPMLPETSPEPWVQNLLDLYRTTLAKPALTEGQWYLDWIEQKSNRLSMTDPQGGYYDGELAWRLVRSLEPDVELKIGLVRRDVPEPRPRYELVGRRRRYIDQSGMFDEAYRPGELTQSMCNPWTHDFRDCACHYWASNHPDVVLHEPTPPRTPVTGWAQRLKSGAIYVDWLRRRDAASTVAARGTIAQNRPYQIDHYEMNQVWQTLPFVVDGREIEGSYAPPEGTPYEPYPAPKHLVTELEKVLGPMELALAMQYLYALFSLLDPESDEAAGLDSRWPTLRDDLRAVRQYLLLIAVSEMTHLRWVNQILWELDRHGFYPGVRHYRPVVRWADQLPTGGSLTELEPLTPETLARFIELERPKGGLLVAYGRCVATLRQEKYPKHLLEIALRIDGEGFAHYERFNEIRRILAPYNGTRDGYPYLRSIVKATVRQTRRALNLFDDVRGSIRGAYAAEARQDFAEAKKKIDVARSTMLEFRDEGERLAKKGLGIPLFRVKK
jgi:Ferritin-like